MLETLSQQCASILSRSRPLPEAVAINPQDERALLRASDPRGPYVRNVVEPRATVGGIPIRIDRAVPPGKFRLEYEHTRDRMAQAVVAAIGDYFRRCDGAPAGLHIGLHDHRSLMGDRAAPMASMRMAVTIEPDNALGGRLTMVRVDVYANRMLPPRAFYLTPGPSGQDTMAIGCSMPGHRPPFIWVNDPFGDGPEAWLADADTQIFAHNMAAGRSGTTPRSFIDARRFMADHLIPPPDVAVAPPHGGNPLRPAAGKKWEPKPEVELGGEPAADIVDQISELVDSQLGNFANRSGYDRPVNQAQCPNPACDYDWHGLPITENMRLMRAAGRYQDGYRYDRDDSQVLCPGSEAWRVRPKNDIRRVARGDLPGSFSNSSAAGQDTAALLIGED